MRGNDKSVPPLCPAHSQLIADTVRLLRCDLPRIEGLSYLIAQHIIGLFLSPACHGGIAGFRQKKLVRHGGGVALISGDILSAFCFLRVFAIVQTIPDSLGNRFAFACMALQQSCGSQKSSLPSMKKGGPSRPPRLRASMARGCLTCQKPVQSGFASVQRPKKGVSRRLQPIRRKEKGEE